eukprot:TRINITY_DN415_c0_g8_i1.p1 TRINITY_DN415_c0_g8~~TRINITY_DN415_c0_g8_i1.p1  ORF type:complete len:518 (-),score=88.65 TRINITY_DN415_c0_g8_i1:225-1778(-)
MANNSTNRNNSAFALLALVFIGSWIAACSAASSCSLTPDQLKAVRLAAAAEFSDRVNRDVNTYIDISNKYLALNGSIEVDYVGVFAPRFVAVEYGTLIYAGDVNITFGPIIPGSTQWLDDHTLLYAMPYSQRKDFYGNLPPFTYSSGIFNLTEQEVIIFDPDSCENPKIFRDIIIDNPLTRALNEASGRAQTTSVTDICYAIQYLACPEGSQFQQFDSIGDCINYFSTQVPSSSVQGLCPQPFSSKTLLCALIHLTSAFVDPTVHCPHVGKNSEPCQDRCLSDCASCSLPNPGPFPLNDPSTNAVCDTNYQNYIIPGYKCKCLDSTVSRPDLAPVAGRTYCKPITCMSDNDCPVRRGTATCVANKCAPRPGFVWDSSITAFQRRDMSVCPYGPARIFKKNGLSYCVEPGACLANSTNNLQCIPLYNPLKVTCQAVDTADFGVPANIPKRNWGCVCNDGYEGGLGYPCTCPAPKVERFNFRQRRFVCVTPANSHGSQFAETYEEAGSSSDVGVDTDEE